MANQSSGKIVIVGSLMVDHFARVDQFPKAGETVMASEFTLRFGGKGANQAVAAARLGAEVEMVGWLGADQMGDAFERRLAELEVGVSGLHKVEGVATGSAFITLDQSAENTIVVAASANAHASVPELESHVSLVAEADYLLIQNEIPHEMNLTAIEIARANGTKVLYNPAPWRDGISCLKLGVDLVVVNEIEVVGLLGREISSAEQLPDGVVVTRGADSTLAKFGGECYDVPTIDITPIDSVGAGDAFCGALARQLVSGSEFGDALRFANCAAGLSTLKMGAQEAVPETEEVLAKIFLRG